MHTCITARHITLVWLLDTFLISSEIIWCVKIVFLFINEEEVLDITELFTNNILLIK